MNQEPQSLNPNELSFDYQNPRIAEFNISEQSSDFDFIKILWNTMGVEEIVLSIRASGFFENEPLIAVRENEKIVVIEGNRRLAALKCLLNQDLADRLSINRNLLNLTGEVLESLKSIPVIIVENRKDAWKFIGFKHINGPAKWGSFAKAQYISLIKNEYQISLGQIASQIGDTHRTVQKLYQGLKIIEQAETVGRFDRSDITASRLYFSHLYTGLSYEGIKEFIGITDVSEEVDFPVPAEKYDNLGELLIWIFGSRKNGKDPVIQTQNPDLRRLESVVKNKEALFALKDNVPLSYAFELSLPKDETFEQSLLEAKRALQKAQSYQTEGFNGYDVSIMKLAASVAEISEELYQVMEKKYSSLKGDGPDKKRIFSGE